MAEIMFCNSIQLTARHITHIPVLWSLLSMNDFMVLQIFLNGKYFPTIVISTRKWTQFAMQALKMDLNITF